MKALTIQKYGSPDFLEIQDVEKPVPADDQVLIKVNAVSIRPGVKPGHPDPGKKACSNSGCFFFGPTPGGSGHLDRGAPNRLT